MVDEHRCVYCGVGRTAFANEASWLEHWHRHTLEERERRARVKSEAADARVKHPPRIAALLRRMKRRERDRHRYWANHERIRTYQREWARAAYRAWPDKYRAQKRRFDERHREENKLRKAIYYQEHRNAILTRRRAYKQAHRQQERIWQAAYKRKHREQESARERARRAATRQQAERGVSA